MVGALAHSALRAADRAPDPAPDAPLCQPRRLALRRRRLSLLPAAAAEADHRRARHAGDCALLRRLLSLVGRGGEGPRRRLALDRRSPPYRLAVAGQGAAAGRL